MIKLIQLNFLFLFPSPTVPEVARHTGNQLPTGATSLKILVAQGKFYMPRATGHPLVSNPADRRLCIYTYLQKYLAVTKPLRGDETKLLISFNKPYRAVSRDTIRRWIKQVLSNSGIDTNVFSAYSTRSASVSAANSKGVPLDKILSAGGWSRASTFSKYYNKPIVDTHGCDYGSSLLKFD